MPTVVIPSINVTRNKTVAQPPTGMAGSVATILYCGEFTGGTQIADEIVAITNVNQFQEHFPALEDEEYKTSYSVVQKVFEQRNGNLGATELIILPCKKDYNSTDFADYLDRLEPETFDILMIPTPIDDLPTESEGTASVFLGLIKTWLNNRFKSQAGVGVVFGLAPTYDETTSTNTELLTDAMSIFEEGVYGALTQSFNGLTLNESVALYTNHLAGLNVSASTTNKVIPAITKLSKEYTYGEDSVGAKLISAGITCFKCFNRSDKEYGVVRAYTPAGYDISIERSADYMTRQFQLNDFLGESSRSSTLDAIAGEVNSRIYNFVNTLAICDDIDATVTKIAANTIEIGLKYCFSGRIITINLIVENVEV